MPCLRMGLRVGGGSRYEALIVGSGMSGALLACILSKRGRRVLMVDRARHPRFALGESTTPLANLALERMGRRYDLPELARLATYGRWKKSYPELRCGLKRGFSFYLQQAGEPWYPSPERRLLVAASPDDRVADTQWLRSDVDQLLVRLATEEGAELWEETAIEAVEATADGVRARTRREEATETETIEADVVIDATGPAGAVARRLGAGPGRATETSSSLLFGHFRGVSPLGGALADSTVLDGAPYSEDWAAVHHLLEEGWMYLLRFDDGLTSAGLLLDRHEDPGFHASPGRGEPEALWQEAIERYPTLRSLFEQAEVERPVEWRQRVQHRLSAAFGPRWIAMPHTYGFVDPLFSVGIAWSLRGVERLAQVLLDLGPDDATVASGEAFGRYGALLEREVDQIDRLVAVAYRARRRFDLFAAHSMLYFAWVSFTEASERLTDPARPWWGGFLGAGEGWLEGLLRESGRRIDAVLRGPAEEGGYEAWVAETIEPLNLAGLADPSRGNLYPVDLDILVKSAHKLGLAPGEILEALPRLRGGEDW